MLSQLKYSYLLQYFDTPDALRVLFSFRGCLLAPEDESGRDATLLAAAASPLSASVGVKDTVQITHWARVAESKQPGRNRARLRKSGGTFALGCRREQRGAGVIRVLSARGIAEKGGISLLSPAQRVLLSSLTPQHCNSFSIKELSVFFVAHLVLK